MSSIGGGECNEEEEEEPSSSSRRVVRAFVREGANIIVSSSLMNEMAFLIFRVGVGCYQHAAFERDTQKERERLLLIP
tara:strand:- start:353 stop:586 length:234 start_codon:yes stop_codon:yes gene_type:complete